MSLENRLRAYADVECNVSFKTRTTFRIGGNCAYYVYPKNYLCLIRIMEILKQDQVPCKIFGKGSNLLCSDDDYDGVVISLDRYFSEFHFEEDGCCIAEAGCSIILLAHEAMKVSLTGLEFASGIPGTLGGALFMNAGAYNSNMAAIVKEVYVLIDQEVKTLSLEQLEYGYRKSIFQQHRDWIILGAKLQLEKGNQKEIRSLMDSRRERRMSSQPLSMPNAGSVFRNPEGHAAWKLIEDADLRGMEVGGAQVSEKHANFIVNANNASAQDVAQLMAKIQETVYERFQVELKSEVEKFNWKQ